MQHRPRWDNLVFEIGEGRRGEDAAYTGDVLKRFLDADLGPETFEVAGPWLGFDLQHVKEDCYLIMKWCINSVERSEEEALEREK